MQGICRTLVDRMKISTSYHRLGCDTQGNHLEVRTVYSGSKEEIDLLEEKVRSGMGDMQTVEVFVNGESFMMEDSKWQARN